MMQLTSSCQVLSEPFVLSKCMPMFLKETSNCASRLMENRCLCIYIWGNHYKPVRLCKSLSVKIPFLEFLKEGKFHFFLKFSVVLHSCYSSYPSISLNNVLLKSAWLLFHGYSSPCIKHVDNYLQKKEKKNPSSAELLVHVFWAKRQ